MGCQATVAGAINGGTDVFAEVRVTRSFLDPDGDPVTVGPVRAHRVPLVLSGGTAMLSPYAGELFVTLSTETPVTIEVRVVDAADAPLGCAASQTVDPAAETVIAGSFRAPTLNIN